VGTINLVITIVTALLGSSVVATIVKWYLDRLNRTNTEQHNVNLGALHEVRTVIESFKSESNERFHDIATALRMSSTLSETFGQKLHAVSERLDEVQAVQSRILARLEAVEEQTEGYY
jgi:hypothetical protein